LLGGFAHELRGWARIDTGPGRLFPWIAVAYGLGIVLYFTADREPLPFAAVALSLGLGLLAAAARRRPAAFAITLSVAAAAAGFATGTVNRTMIDHPVLPFPVWNVQIEGFVEVEEERARSDRIVVRIHHIEGARLSVIPDRVRLSVRKGTAPAVGSFVKFKARLSPPLEPLSPGGYDFARDMYFRGIGASGFVLGRIEVAAAPTKGGWWLSYAAIIDWIRDTIDKHIRAVLPGDKGTIASALITGKQGGISQPVTDAMFISGIGHVLSISGYHMVVVVGIVFFAVRASFALVPGFGRFPIKKWATAVEMT
jgi:competence protein ComEC